MVMNERVHSMTEGALAAALMVIVTLIGTYMPAIGVFFILLWPLPILVVSVRRGLRLGVMSAVVASALVAMLIEPVGAVRLLVSFAPVGLVLGYGFMHGWGGTRILISALVTSMASKGILLLVFFLVTGVEPFSMQFDVMEESVDSSVRIYEEMGFSGEELEKVKAQSLENISTVRLLVPLLVVMVGLFDAVINYLAGVMVLKRLGFSVPALPPFHRWRLSPLFLYMFGFSLIGLYWGQKEGMGIIHRAAMNLYFASALAGFVEGLSLYSFAARRFKWPKIFSWLGLVFIMMTGFLAQILIFMGLLDTTFDYRAKYIGEDRG